MIQFSSNGTHLPKSFLAATSLHCPAMSKHSCSYLSRIHCYVPKSQYYLAHRHCNENEGDMLRTYVLEGKQDNSQEVIRGGGVACPTKTDSFKSMINTQREMVTFASLQLGQRKTMETSCHPFRLRPPLSLVLIVFLVVRSGLRLPR